MKKHLAIIALSLVLILIAMAPAALAADAPVKTKNAGSYEYSYDRWAKTVKSYLEDNGDGTYTRVEYTGEAVTVETYDSSLTFTGGFSIEMELPIFGGFYSGSDSNFLIFGQRNPDEDDTMEVIRVVRYTKDWERLGAASLCGANTVIPFDAGSLRCAEYNGYLYIRTSHEMYTSDDGLNHQANLTMNVRIADMVITDSFYKVMNIRYGYASHSFNQFIAVDEGKLVAVDHGDAHPRSVVLTRYFAPAGQDKFMVAQLESLGDGYYRYVYAENVDALPIMGNTGDNDTGVSIGGFQISDSAYLIAGNTVSQDENYDEDGQRNIFVSATSKENFTAEGTTVNYLTSYAEGDGVTVSNPHFTKIDTDRYIVLWTQSGSGTSTLCYVFVDGTGAPVSEIYTAEGYLSDCQPIVSDNRVIWYVTSGSEPAFYIIDLDDPSDLVHGHNYTYAKKVNPTLTTEGSLSAACTICGAEGEDVFLPALNLEDYTIRMRSLANCTHGGTDYYYLNETMYGELIYAVATPRLPHQSYKVEAVPATCIAEGNIEYWDCSTCTNWYWKDEALTTRVSNIVTPIDPDNHAGDTEVVGKLDATCTAEGYSGDTVCSDCGVTIADGTAVEMAEHSYENGVCVHCGKIRGDLDGDTRLTVADVGKMKTLILWEDWTREDLEMADLNDDGRINVLDLLLLRNWILKS